MLKSVVNKTKQHAQAAWGLFTGGRHEAPEVIISGLKPEEKMLQESIIEECQRTLKKVRNEIPARGILLHFKSSEKAKRTYEIHGVLKLDEKDLHADVTERDIYLALKTILDDLLNQSQRERNRRSRP